MSETKNELITVIMKQPGENPEVVTNFDNSLKGYQKAVDGYIETIRLPGMEDQIDIVLNDEGKLRGLKPNIVIPEYSDIAVGTIIVVGVTPDLDWRSLTQDEIDYATDYLTNYSIC